MLSLLLLIGQVIRTKARWTQKLLLPASVIGGLLGLVVVQLMQRYAPGSESFVSDATAAAIVAEGNGYESALVNFRFIANTVWTTKEAVQKISEARP